MVSFKFALNSTTVLMLKLYHHFAASQLHEFHASLWDFKDRQCIRVDLLVLPLSQPVDVPMRYGAQRECCFGPRAHAMVAPWWRHADTLMRRCVARTARSLIMSRLIVREAKELGSESVLVLVVCNDEFLSTKGVFLRCEHG